MKSNQQILCLNMIVKNEVPVVTRCLTSVRPFIDYWVIVDTGSTDGTQDAIRTLMADLPGELYERPWRDFAHNRTEALELAQSHGDYVLIIDADDVLEFEPEFKMPVLQADSYMLRIADGSTRYNRTQIVRAALPWRWRGVLHEFLTCDDARTSGLLDGLLLRRKHDGARQRDPQTYRQDAEVLYAALQTESDPFMQSRYQFYLAQSYRDCGEMTKALQAYLKRAELGFWTDEVFISLFEAGRIQESKGASFEEVVDAYLRASDVAAHRAEALHAASRLCRVKEKFAEGCEYARRGLAIESPADGLYVEDWIYDYALLDEFAVNAFWVGAFEDSLLACERILRERKCPEAERARIERNAGLAHQSLARRLALILPPDWSGDCLTVKPFGEPYGENRRVRFDPAMKRLNIVVPFRARDAHLQRFVGHLRAYFARDKVAREIPYSVLIIEQESGLPFNRGALKNIGFVLGREHCDYTAFHDVDYLPIWADYTFADTFTAIVWYGAEWRPIIPGRPWPCTIHDKSSFFGGVVLVPNASFEHVDGYANSYWGWGYEDTDLANRFVAKKITPGRRTGTFHALDHVSEGYDIDAKLTPIASANQQLFISRWSTAGFSISGQRQDHPTANDGLSTLAFEVLQRRSIPDPTPERSASWEIVTVRLNMQPGVE